MQPEGSRRSHRRGNEWVWGLVLIALGGLFLVQNMTGFELNNWWALFILLPAFGAFGRAIERYRAMGRFSSQVRGPLLGGIVLVVVALVFLFNLQFENLWPILLILGGVLLLVNGMLPD
jgi:hypothetical protein